jgi:hypothetical protein
MLDEYLTNLELANFISKRPFETVYKLALDRDRLKLKYEVDAGVVNDF